MDLPMAENFAPLFLKSLAMTLNKVLGLLFMGTFLRDFKGLNF